MHIKELFTGGQKVREARHMIYEYKNRKNPLSGRDQGRLDKAEKITRRHFLKISGAAVLGLAVGAGLGVWQLTDLLEHKENDDDVRSSYEEAFRKLATGDTQGEKLIEFYRTAARKAHYQGKNIISDEQGTRGENFWVAVVGPDGDRSVLSQLHGVSAYDRNQDILTVKRVKFSEIWKGALFGHEVSHAHNDLVGQEENSQKAFDAGEVAAYDFELHLLDRATGGQLKDRFKKQAETILEGRLRGMLTSQDFAAFDGLFPNAPNREEADLRTVVYTIGINFAVIESRYNTPEEITKEKMKYIRGIFEGQVPILFPR